MGGNCLLATSMPADRWPAVSSSTRSTKTGKIARPSPADLESYDPRKDDYDVRTAPVLPATIEADQIIVKQITALRSRIAKGGDPAVVAHYKKVVAQLSIALRQLRPSSSVSKSSQCSKKPELDSTMNSKASTCCPSIVSSVALKDQVLRPDRGLDSAAVRRRHSDASSCSWSSAISPKPKPVASTSKSAALSQLSTARVVNIRDAVRNRFPSSSTNSIAAVRAGRVLPLCSLPGQASTTVQTIHAKPLMRSRILMRA
jgi:hypothetical protein